MSAIEFLRRCASGQHRIVSTGDLLDMQIREARSEDRMFVDDETGLGFVLLPWELTTDKDLNRERHLRARQQMLGGE